MIYIRQNIYGTSFYVACMTFNTLRYVHCTEASTVILFLLIAPFSKLCNKNHISVIPIIGLMSILVSQ